MSNFSGLMQQPQQQQQQQQQQPDLTNSYWGTLAQFGLFPNGRGGVAPANGLGLPGQVFALKSFQIWNNVTNLE